MFRSSEAAARARIADLERRLAELNEHASDREEVHEKRVKKLEHELDRLRRGERPMRRGWLIGGGLAALACLAAIGFWARSKPVPDDPDALCQGGDAAACVRRGYELRTADPASAERSFRRGCELGAVEGCSETGWLMMARGDWAGAEPLLQKACDGDNARACVNLGVIVGKRDNAKSGAFHKKACDLGDSLGCSNFASVLDDKGELKKAVEVASKACDKGSPFGCAELSWLKLKDKKVQDAIKHATRATQINAQLPKVQVNLGYALAADGEVEEAIRRFRRGIQLEDKPGNERTFTDKPWGALVRQNLEYLKTVYPDRVKDFDAILGRQREWNP